MNEVKERYVSPRVAELLRLADFDLPTTHYYIKGDNRISVGNLISAKVSCVNWNNADGYYSAPTQAMAREWIEVVHKLFIEVRTGVDIDANNKEIPDSVWFDYDIIPIGTETVIFPERDGYVTYKHSWEAVDAALEYIFEKLILPNRTEDAIRMAKIGHQLI